MSKMGLHDPFGHFKHKLWPTKRSGVKLPIWLPTTKSQESPQFPCMQVVCDISLESSRQVLQLCMELHLNQRPTHKVMGPQSGGSPIFRNFGTPLGNPGTKWHLGAGPVTRHRVYYKGEGDGFPQVRAVVNLVSPCLPVARPCTKMLQLHINQLVVWFVQVCVSDWIACDSSWSHLEAPARPFTLKVLRARELRARECAPTPSPSAIFTFGLPVESIKELGGASLLNPNQHP
jgi:hypothetical protein